MPPNAKARLVCVEAWQALLRQLCPGLCLPVGSLAVPVELYVSGQVKLALVVASAPPVVAPPEWVAPPGALVPPALVPLGVVPPMEELVEPLRPPVAPPSAVLEPPELVELRNVEPPAVVVADVEPLGVEPLGVEPLAEPPIAEPPLPGTTTALEPVDPPAAVVGPVTAPPLPRSVELLAATLVAPPLITAPLPYLPLTAVNWPSPVYPPSVAESALFAASSGE